MQGSPSHWSRSLIRRGLVVAVTIASLAALGLFGATTQSLSLRPTASASVAANSALAVSVAVSPTNQSVNVAAQGPGNSLYFYWQIGGQWHGPLGLGGSNTTFSAPSIAAETNGNFEISVEGPNNTLYTYWDASGTWYGPLAIGGGGTTFSTPSLAVEPHGGNLDVLAEGPNHTLNQWWNTASDAAWHGPIPIDGPGTTFSAPSLSARTRNATYNSLFASNVGPNNDLRAHSLYQAAPGSGGDDNVWNNGDSSNDNTAFSAPSDDVGDDVFMGPSNALYQSYCCFSSTYAQVRGAGSAFSSASVVNNEDDFATEGPSNSLYFYVYNGDNGYNPLQLGVPGSTFSAPSMAVETSGTIDIVVQGPSHSLYAYWDANGAYYGPVQVAGAGTTFTSTN